MCIHDKLIKILTVHDPSRRPGIALFSKQVIPVCIVCTVIVCALYIYIHVASHDYTDTCPV